jgi:threonine dehydrogenase-like Zn-dependent dehydrogenase
MVGLLARKDRWMLAAEIRGPYRVRATRRRLPRIKHPRDAVIGVTRSCVCGSDLHLYHGFVPDTRIGLTFGQASVKRLLPRLIEHVREGRVTPKALITHRLELEYVSDAYRMNDHCFRRAASGCPEAIKATIPRRRSA